MSTMSYTHGASETPLLGETISRNLRRTAARVPENEALVVPHQGYRANYWKFVDSFPTTLTGKVQKFKMREAAIEELQLEKAAAVQTA